MSQLQRDIRALLKQMPNGATNIELSELLGTPTNIIRASCIRMPDVYIGRWIVQKRTQPEMVWMVVEVPMDAPKPKFKLHIKVKNAKRDNAVLPENKYNGRSRKEDRFVSDLVITDSKPDNGVKTKWVTVQPWQH